MSYKLMISKKQYGELAALIKELKSQDNTNEITKIFKFVVQIDDREAIRVIIDNVHAGAYFTYSEGTIHRITFTDRKNTIVYMHKLAVDIVIHYSPKPKEVLALLPIDPRMLFPSTLHESAFNGDEDKIKEAVEKLDDSEHPIRFSSLLNYAAAGQQLQIIKIILEWLRSKQKYVATLFHPWFSHNRNEFDNFTPLHIGVNQNNKELVKHIQSYDAWVLVFYRFGGPQELSPLTMAVMRGNLDHVQNSFAILYENNPKYFTSDNYSKDAGKALVFGSTEIVLFFLKRGVSIEVVQNSIPQIENIQAEKIKLLKAYLQLIEEISKGKTNTIPSILTNFPDLAQAHYLTLHKKTLHCQSLLHCIISAIGNELDQAEAIKFLLKNNNQCHYVLDSEGKLPIEYFTLKNPSIRYLLSSPLERNLRFLFTKKEASSLIQNILKGEKGLGTGNPIKIEFTYLREGEEYTELDTFLVREFLCNKLQDIHSFTQYPWGRLSSDMSFVVNQCKEALEGFNALTQSEFSYLEPLDTLSTDERTMLQQILHNFQNLVAHMHVFSKENNAIPVVVELPPKAPSKPATSPTLSAKTLPVSDFFPSPRP